MKLINSVSLSQCESDLTLNKLQFKVPSMISVQNIRTLAYETYETRPYSTLRSHFLSP